MDRLFVKRIALVVAFVGLSLGGWLATRGSGNVDAIGGTWAVEDAAWHEMDGAYRAMITYTPERVRIANVDGLGVLTSLCDATLANLDVAGQPDLTAADIYRLDLNFVLDDGQTGLAAAPSIPVVDGVCVMDRFEGDTFYPTYPGALAGWYLSDVGLMNAGEDGMIHVLQFKAIEGAGAELSGFDLARACAAVLDDPAPWQNPEFDAPPAGRIHVRAMQGGSVGVFQSDTLQIVDGTCVEDTV